MTTKSLPSIISYRLLKAFNQNSSRARLAPQDLAKHVHSSFSQQGSPQGSPGGSLIPRILCSLRFLGYGTCFSSISCLSHSVVARLRLLLRSGRRLWTQRTFITSWGDIQNQNCPQIEYCVCPLKSTSNPSPGIQYDSPHTKCYTLLSWSILSLLP